MWDLWCHTNRMLKIKQPGPTTFCDLLMLLNIASWLMQRVIPPAKKKTLTQGDFLHSQHLGVRGIVGLMLVTPLCHVLVLHPYHILTQTRFISFVVNSGLHKPSIKATLVTLPSSSDLRWMATSLRPVHFVTPWALINMTGLCYRWGLRDLSQVTDFQKLVRILQMNTELLLRLVSWLVSWTRSRCRA